MIQHKCFIALRCICHYVVCSGLSLEKKKKQKWISYHSDHASIICYVFVIWFFLLSFFILFVFSLLQAIAGYFDIFFEKGCHNKVCGGMHFKNNFKRKYFLSSFSMSKCLAASLLCCSIHSYACVFSNWLM